jgi:hypothetical protein
VVDESSWDRAHERRTMTMTTIGRERGKGRGMGMSDLLA